MRIRALALDRETQRVSATKIPRLRSVTFGLPLHAQRSLQLPHPHYPFHPSLSSSCSKKKKKKNKPSPLSDDEESFNDPRGIGNFIKMLETKYCGHAGMRSGQGGEEGGSKKRAHKHVGLGRGGVIAACLLFCSGGL